MKLMNTVHTVLQELEQPKYVRKEREQKQFIIQS